MFFFTAMLVFMALTLVSLVFGIIIMGKGGTQNERYGNRLMQLRVILQGVTLGLFALTILTSS